MTKETERPRNKPVLEDGMKFVPAKSDTAATDLLKTLELTDEELASLFNCPPGEIA